MLHPRHKDAIVTLTMTFLQLIPLGYVVILCLIGNVCSLSHGLVIGEIACARTDIGHQQPNDGFVGLGL